MWDFTREDKDRIAKLYSFFLEDTPEEYRPYLYDRIFSGYCWGEGGLRITTIEDWEDVFANKGMWFLFSEFKSWEEYVKSTDSG